MKLFQLCLIDDQHEQEFWSTPCFPIFLKLNEFQIQSLKVFTTPHFQIFWSYVHGDNNVRLWRFYPNMHVFFKQISQIVWISCDYVIDKTWKFHFWIHFFKNCFEDILEMIKTLKEYHYLLGFSNFGIRFCCRDQNGFCLKIYTRLDRF